MAKEVEAEKSGKFLFSAKGLNIIILLIGIGMICILLPTLYVQILNNLGYINLVEGINLNSAIQLTVAENQFRQSTIYEKNNPSAIMGLGLVISFQRSIDVAQKYWDVISINPSSQYVAWGDIARFEESYPDAQYWYQTAIGVDPFNARAWHQAGALQEELGFVDMAIKSYQKSISFGNPASVNPLGLLFYH